MTPRLPSVMLTNDEITLVRTTIAAFEIGGCVRQLLARATAVAGGWRIQGTYEELDDLLGAVAVEVRGFMRLDEERAGKERDEPLQGTAARLAIIYDKIEQLRS